MRERAHVGTTWRCSSPRTRQVDTPHPPPLVQRQTSHSPSPSTLDDTRGLVPRSGFLFTVCGDALNIPETSGVYRRAARFIFRGGSFRRALPLVFLRRGLVDSLARSSGNASLFRRRPLSGNAVGRGKGARGRGRMFPDPGRGRGSGFEAVRVAAARLGEEFLQPGGHRVGGHAALTARRVGVSVRFGRFTSPGSALAV